jgi:hypothetical protein
MLIYLYILTAIYVLASIVFPYQALVVYVALASPAAYAILRDWANEAPELAVLDILKRKV